MSLSELIKRLQELEAVHGHRFVEVFLKFDDDRSIGSVPYEFSSEVLADPGDLEAILTLIFACQFTTNVDGGFEPDFPDNE